MIGQQNDNVAFFSPFINQGAVFRFWLNNLAIDGIVQAIVAGEFEGKISEVKDGGTEVATYSFIVEDSGPGTNRIRVEIDATETGNLPNETEFFHSVFWTPAADGVKRMLIDGRPKLQTQA